MGTTDPAANGGDDADWLWGQLMDWCRSQRIAPAMCNDLFAIVGRLRARRDARAEDLAGRLTCFAGITPWLNDHARAMLSEAAAFIRATKSPREPTDVRDVIAHHVRQIEILCDASGLDPFEWLADDEQPHETGARPMSAHYRDIENGSHYAFDERQYPETPAMRCIRKGCDEPAMGLGLPCAAHYATAAQQPQTSGDAP